MANPLLFCQPLLNLAHREAPEVPEKTLLLSYESTNVFVAFVRSLRRKDYLVALGTFLSILSLLLQPFAGALFTVRDVWWLGHGAFTRNHFGVLYVKQYSSEFSVNGLSKVGVNRAANFMDMTAFLAASSFASADVIYHIGPPPFVSGGYTVGEFEITDNDIGILYANRSAVLSQAVCSAPDSLAMVNEQNERSVWHNTALFGHCQYTWTVNSNATYLFDCGQDYASVPIQYRPVLFWFFMYSPEPTASVVLCIPHASGLTVSVAINLATKSTDVTPLQSSPDDANSTDIGSFTYNGLFFDEASMDETSLARLQSIQQQLPGAVFEAAKANDTMLLSTFTSNGFTALAQDVYTTYLSLVAKSLYLIEDHSTLSVRVGSNCKRIFLVPSAVVILCIAMSALVILGSFLHMSHYHARRGLPIPSGLGTLSAAIWLTAQTDLALALADDEATPDKIEERLSGHRYFIHKQSGRILRLPDPESGRDTPLSASKGLSAWLLPLRRKSAGLVSQKNSNSSASDVEIANAV
ncbi:hypothetical protein BN946_scf184664.g3 [Trametes cinnabarina]|uniref:Uncharacterized protein n=1 Tax=Pycnoporus cinnabarinus TaxID=5643 RepID=A0A060SV24_PYCCI|nr:hypothetical protein BN946_scf184664.g3 [Trametes cinnabarina]